MPKISVIIPVYNVDNLLYKCIKSMLNQTFYNFEVILIDDGSIDKSGRLIDEYALMDFRISVIHKKNFGVSAARNDGLAFAKGDYISFVDSDDYVDSCFLEICYNALLTTNVDCLSFNFKRIAADDVLFESDFLTEYKQIAKVADKWHFFIKYFFLYKYGHEVCFFVFKRSIINKYNIRFCTTCNNFAEDMGFSFKYLLHADSISGINDVLYYYSVRDDSMMKKSKNIIKINELNEVSIDSFHDYQIEFSGSMFDKAYCIIHFLFMYNQFSKIILTDKYPYLGEIVEKVEKKKWFRQQTRHIFRNYKLLKECFGSIKAKQILLFSTYCLHGNWNLYGIESKLAYKFFIKERT